jgi:hypothetical protein
MSLSHHRLHLHHLPPAAPPAADPYYVYAPHAHAHPDPQRQGVVTLFVAGLPDDVKPREIHNLFSRRPGFDQCLLEYTGRGNQVTSLSLSPQLAVFTETEPSLRQKGGRTLRLGCFFSAI